MNHLKYKTNQGLITQIVIIIIAAVVLSLFGFNPAVLWNEYAVPAIRWIWEVLFSVISFLIEVVVFFVEKIRGVES